MTISRMRRLSVVALLIATGLSGCAFDTTSRGVASNVELQTTSPYVLDGCIRPDDGHLLSIPNQAAPPTSGVVLGRGNRAVVISPMTSRNICPWLSFGQSIAARGYQVALYDYNGKTPDEVQLASVVAEVRARGARWVVLIGAGDGASTSLIGAAGINPPVNGVIALSPERRLAGRAPTENYVRRLRMPLLFATATEDIGQSAAAVRTYQKAAPAVEKRVVMVQGSAHGIELLASADGAVVESAITSFIDVHTRS
jgi:hypothetical protein